MIKDLRWTFLGVDGMLRGVLGGGISGRPLDDEFVGGGSEDGVVNLAECALDDSALGRGVKGNRESCSRRGAEQSLRKWWAELQMLHRYPFAFGSCRGCAACTGLSVKCDFC